MTVSMYKISAPIFVQFLTSLSGVLDKTAAYCEAKKVEPSALLTARLSPDMYPLARQVRAASALAGSEMLNLPNTETSFDELKGRLAKANDYLRGFKPAQIDGTEDKDITLKLGTNERKFTGQGLLLNFILPNFYFHCTTAYDILRHRGIELGKRDFMSQPANL